MKAAYSPDQIAAAKKHLNALADAPGFDPNAWPDATDDDAVQYLDGCVSPSVDAVEDVIMFRVNLQEVADLVIAAGIPCNVWHTGGHIATLYAGEPMGRTDYFGEPLYPAIAGPGFFTGAGVPFADAEVFVGADGDVCPGGVECVAVGARTATAIAKMVIAQARKPPGEWISEAEARAAVAG